MSGEASNDSKNLVQTNQGQLTVRAKGLKRKLPTVFNGEEANRSAAELLCPICSSLIDSAYMTECGHSFCYKCILECLETQSRCPQCGSSANLDRIFPNFSLNTVITQQRHKLKQSKTPQSLVEDVTELIKPNSSSDHVSYEDVSKLIDILEQKRNCLMLESEMGEARLTLEFLNHIKEAKVEKLKDLERELAIISNDVDMVKKKANVLETKLSNFDWKCGSSNNKIELTNAAIRQRISTHASDLHDYYFSMRSGALIGAEVTEQDSSLQNFTHALSKFAKYREFRQLATLTYTSDLYNMYSIVSSIEFDKDADFFAIAGVTKKIKVYDYRQVVGDVVDMHYPITEMSCASKISCIAWNPYHKNELASSDYEGAVTLWDPFTTKKTHLFQEHEKRCWCVDFNKMNPHLLASGSDDSKVKIWSSRSPRSVLNIEAVANVCCVKFNPCSSYHLAFGAADHCVHYYDLRKTTEPLLMFKGHLKAVSYAKFLNGEEVVSASTDSQLKLWNVNKGTNAVRTFQGHINEKNFVGLASDADFIACGSEDNSLCVYYKGLTRTLHKYKFDIIRSAWQRETSRDEDANEFVSAVAWMPGSGVIIVANSQGIVKVLELV